MVFLTALGVSGLNLVFDRALRPVDVRLGSVSMLVIVLLGAVIVANAVTVFLEEGLHWTLPDDPKHYQFFEDVRPDHRTQP